MNVHPNANPDNLTTAMKTKVKCALATSLNRCMQFGECKVELMKDKEGLAYSALVTFPSREVHESCSVFSHVNSLHSGLIRLR